MGCGLVWNELISGLVCSFRIGGVGGGGGGARDLVYVIMVGNYLGGGNVCMR